MSKNVFNCLEACKGLPFPYEQCVSECNREFESARKPPVKASMDPRIARAKFANFRAALAQRMGVDEDKNKKQRRVLCIVAGGGLLAAVAAIGIALYMKKKSSS